MSLSRDINSIIGPIKERAGQSIDRLATTATQLDMKDTAQVLRASGENLRSDNFNLIVVGRFKNGKSTLMNALLGRLTHPVPELKGVGPMPVDALPATAVLTSINYATSPYVKMHTYGGMVQEWSFSQYLRDAVVKDSEEATIKFFENIMQFEVGLPAELCQAGVTLIDSPGLGDTPKRNEITSIAISRCDAAIVVYRSEPFAGMDEIEFATKQVAGSNTRVFTVINMYNEDAQNVSERFKRFAWNRLVGSDRGGAAYNGQDFAAHDIFFVNAKEADQGKRIGDATLVQKSGIAHLEKRLAEFLVKDRHYVHMLKFVTEGENGATRIETTIGQRKAALQADQQKLQQKYEEIRPQLDAVRSRRDKLPPLFDSAARDARRAVKISFEQMIMQLRHDLPDELANRKLPSEGGILNMLASAFKQKQLCQEAADVCTEIITARISEWGKSSADRPGVTQALEPVLNVLYRDLEDEAAQLDRAMRDIHFQMTGWTPPLDGPTSIVSTKERVLSALGAFAVGDIFGAIGAGGGWRGVVGAIGGQVAAIIVLSAMGLLAAPIAIPAILVAAAFSSAAGSAVGMGKRVREKVIEHVDAGLKKAPETAQVEIEAQVSKLFKDMEREAMKVMQAVIDEEESNIRQMLELNKRSMADRDKALNVLNEMGTTVTAARQSLKNVDVAYKQVA